MANLIEIFAEAYSEIYSMSPTSATILLSGAALILLILIGGSALIAYEKITGQKIHLP
jgi:hypothetical protein